MLHRLTRNLLTLSAFILTALPMAGLAETGVSSETPFGAIYTDEHPGSAGHWPKGNVYQFNITKVSGHAVVLIEATKPQKGSKGDVLLLTDGKGLVLIGSWDQQKFPEHGFRFDVSKYITKPGPYAVRFDYRSGEWHLAVSKVSIDTRK